MAPTKVLLIASMFCGFARNIDDSPHGPSGNKCYVAAWVAFFDAKTNPRRAAHGKGPLLELRWSWRALLRGPRTCVVQTWALKGLLRAGLSHEPGRALRARFVHYVRNFAKTSACKVPLCRYHIDAGTISELW